MEPFQLIYALISYVVTTIIIVTVVLMILRLVVTYADVNPFNWLALTVRRFTDPLVGPIRRALVGFGVDPKFAPLITILLVILVGYFAIMLASSVLNTMAGVLYATERHAVAPLIGYVLYGLLALYSLLIFIRIIFSWGMVSYANPVMRFLVNTTDPLLVPLRRMIPPLAMFDLSPIIAFILIWLFQAAIAGTLLRGFPLQLIG